MSLLNALVAAVLGASLAALLLAMCAAWVVIELIGRHRYVPACELRVRRSRVVVICLPRLFELPARRELPLCLN